GAAIALALSVGGISKAAEPLVVPAYVASAAADASRGSADLAKDSLRKGPEIMAFAGVKPGDRVLELIPGAGYFTRLFSKIVGPTGHVYAVWPEPYDKGSHPD